MRERKEEKYLSFIFKQTLTTLFTLSRAYESCFACQKFYFQPYEARQEARASFFVTHRTRFYWIIKSKPKIHVLILRRGSCNFQPFFGGGPVIFGPKGGGGPCVFINHISKCSAPYTFWPVSLNLIIIARAKSSKQYASIFTRELFLPFSKLLISMPRKPLRAFKDEIKTDLQVFPGFHMTSLKFKLQNYGSYRDFTFMMYLSSWKLIFIQIFASKGFLVLW